MEDARDLLSVHLCSLLAPVSMFLLHLLTPGGLLSSPLLLLSLLSLANSLLALVAPVIFFPLELRFSPVKPFRHHVRLQLLGQQDSLTEATIRHLNRTLDLSRWSSVVQVVLGSTALYVIVGALLGANPVRQLSGTVVWALLMTSLTSVPAVIVLDSDYRSWRRVFLDRLFVSAAERSLCVMIMTTLLGAWLGAVPIPLDWNRAWQVWPIPSCCGAVAGSVLGSGCSLLAQQFSLYPTQLSLQSRWVSRHHHRHLGRKRSGL